MTFISRIVVLSLVKLTNPLFIELEVGSGEDGLVECSNSHWILLGCLPSLISVVFLNSCADTSRSCCCCYVQEVSFIVFSCEALSVTSLCRPMELLKWGFISFLPHSMVYLTLVHVSVVRKQIVSERSPGQIS